MVKSISRFARNTVDLLETIKRLKGLRIEVIFHQEDLRTSKTENDVLISILGAIAQEESESIEKVQEEMKRRSDVGIVDGRYMRKKTHYSTKRAEVERRIQCWCFVGMKT